MVRLHIKLKIITNAATWQQIFCPQTPTPDPRDGSIGQRSTFQNRVLLHIKLKGITKCSNMVANYFASKNHPSPYDPGGLGVNVEIELFQNMVMLHIKLKGITKCSSMVAIYILPTDAYPPTPP